jgi:hypothetical protein
MDLSVRRARVEGGTVCRCSVRREHDLASTTASRSRRCRRGPAPGEGSGILHANFESTVDPALNVVDTFGGAGQPRDPAVIRSGRCRGGKHD